MRPQETGIVELHDTKQNERGFGCMKLITFLTRDGEKEWERWHGAHLQAAAGQCPYTGECPIRTTIRDSILTNSERELYL
uniref:hypothetical protein n=1 Tax=Bacteroides acidifaciens TaxID=85831 RepID=UPI0025A60CE5